MYTALWLLLYPSKVLVHTIQSFSCCNWRMATRQYELCCNNQLTRRVLRHTQISVFNLLSLTINSTDEEVAGGGRWKSWELSGLKKVMGNQKRIAIKMQLYGELQFGWLHSPWPVNRIPNLKLTKLKDCVPRGRPSLVLYKVQLKGYLHFNRRSDLKWSVVPILFLLLLQETWNTKFQSKMLLNKILIYRKSLVGNKNCSVVVWTLCTDHSVPLDNN